MLFDLGVLLVMTHSHCLGKKQADNYSFFHPHELWQYRAEIFIAIRFMVYNKPQNMKKNKTNPSSRVTLRVPLPLASKILRLAAKANLSTNQTVKNLLMRALSLSTSEQAQATRQSLDSESDG